MKKVIKLKRLIYLTLLLAAFMFSNAYAAGTVTTTITLSGTQNLISLPCVPVNSSPVYIFSGYAIDNDLKTWMPEIQDYNIFNIVTPENFGGVLLGESYWLTGNANDVISYESLPSGIPTDGIKTDTWLSLSGEDDSLNIGGRHIVGCPYDETVPIANIWFTDGIDVKSWYKAKLAGWVGPTLSYWNGSSYEDITFDGSSGVRELEPGKGYLVDTYFDNIAMMIIAPYNPLPKADYTSLQGTVGLQNYDGNKANIPVTVDLSGTSYNLNLDSNGTFVIYDVAAGTYDIRIKASHWLAKATYGVVVSGDTVIDQVSLINGDVVDNNEVDFSDINAVRAAYGSFPGDETWDDKADIDGTGEVDFSDINIVRSKYGEIGD